MRELKNNNIEIGKIQQRKDIKTNKAEEALPQLNQDEEKIAKDFSNPSAEVLGRSQVAPADALQKDVEFAIANPEAVEKADKFFEMTLAQLDANGYKDAYAKASEITSGYVKEFASK